MHCTNCGNKVPDNVKFCTVCGTPLGSDTAGQTVDTVTPDPSQGEQYVTKNIVRCKDGLYRWIYSVSLMKNPTILYTLWKVFGITIGIMFVIFLFIGIADGNLGESIVFDLKMFGIIGGILFVLSILGYLIYAAINGGKYIVLFEMGEEGIQHIQQPKQFDKMNSLADIGELVGLFTGNITLMGNSMLAGSKQIQESKWENVGRVRSVRHRHVIYLSELFNKNQVYAADEDFDFVESYIKSRCTNAKIS